MVVAGRIRGSIPPPFLHNRVFKVSDKQLQACPLPIIPNRFLMHDIDNRRKEDILLIGWQGIYGRAYQCHISCDLIPCRKDGLDESFVVLHTFAGEEYLVIESGDSVLEIDGIPAQIRQYLKWVVLCIA